MNETDYGVYCKKCFLKKHKMSKKNIERIIFTHYMEACACCGKAQKLVEDIEEDYE